MLSQPVGVRWKFWAPLIWKSRRVGDQQKVSTEISAPITRRTLKVLPSP